MPRGFFVFWYYLLILLGGVVALALGDFSTLSETSRYVIIGLGAVAIVNPFVWLWYLGAKPTIISQTDQLQKLVVELQQANKRSSEKARETEAKDLELTMANKHLSELEKAKSEFVLVTTHQLRTPLSAIKWALQMIKAGDLGPVTGEQKQLLDRSALSVQEVITIVNDLLNIDYIENNESRYQMAEFNLVELSQGIVDEFKLSNRVKEKNLQLEFNVDQPNLPPVEGDALRLKMVIENLVDNAINYARDGSAIKVKISGDKLNSARSALEVVVANEGIGIPEAEQGKIFQRFFRSTNAIKTKPDGTGLGLFIAKDIIGHHGGEIWFESKENKGATFHFTVPLRQAVTKV